jgi:hypothetical protein
VTVAWDHGATGAAARTGHPVSAAGHPLGAAVAVGAAVAASPLAFTSSVVLLGSRRPLGNGWAFASGWTTSVAVFAVLIGAAGAKVGASASGPSSTAATVELVLGILLILAGGYAGLTRRRSPAGEPRWLAAVDRISPVVAFLLGALLPTWGMIAPAVSAIDGAGLSTGLVAALLVVFVLVASTSVIGPALLYTVRRQRAAATLARARAWVTAHNRSITAVVLVVLGLLFSVDGLTGR